MATKRLVTNQHAIDATLLTYGRQEALFKLHATNDSLIDKTKKVPELMIPAQVEGKDLIFDVTDRLFDLNVAQAMARDTTSLATGGQELIGGVQDRGFSLGFSLGFNA